MRVLGRTGQRNVRKASEDKEVQCATASVAMEHAAETVSSPVVVAWPFAIVPSSTSLGCSEYRGMLDGECYRRRGEHGWYEYTRALNMRPVLEFRPHRHTASWPWLIWISSTVRVPPRSLRRLRR